MQCEDFSKKSTGSNEAEYQHGWMSKSDRPINIPVPIVTVPQSGVKNHSNWHSGRMFIPMLEFNGKEITKESGIRSGQLIIGNGVRLR